MKFLLKSFTVQRFIVVSFFTIYLLMGSFIIKDYGISWDEPIQRHTGYINSIYVFQGNIDLIYYKDRIYGPVFEIPLFLLEKVLHLNDSRDIYLMRHFFTFALFYISLIAFYFLLRKVVKDWRKALIGCSILVLSPRIFADSFYNSKDIPFMSLFIISSYTLILLLEKMSLKRIFFHALASAVLVDVRILGIVMIMMTIFLLIVDFLVSKKHIINQIKFLFLYILTTSFFTILFWPFLWKNPANNLMDSIKNLSQLSNYTNVPILYFRKFISAFNLPWHYIPVWIFITTPLSYILLFFLGVIKLITGFLKKKNIRNIYQSYRIELIILILLLGPTIALILLKSRFYDGWRHLYFIYPFMVVFMVKGISILPRLLIIPIILEIITVLIFMIQYHPYQNLYFNLLMNQDMNKVKQNFELDYWGLSYRKALEHILITDKSPIISVVVDNNSGKFNSLIIPKNDRGRLKYLSKNEIGKAKYFIGNYRWHNWDYGFGEEIYNVKIGGTKIITVQKLK